MHSIEIAISPDEMLIDVLRDKLELTGTKKGCGKGECAYLHGNHER